MKTKKPVLKHTYGDKFSTTEEAHAQFSKAVGPAKDNGANTCTGKFIQVMEAVLATHPATFTIQDVLYHSKPYMLEPTLVLKLFTVWRETFLALNKIDTVSGIYDDETIIVLS
jgi:hypothetical protein